MGRITTSNKTKSYVQCALEKNTKKAKILGSIGGVSLYPGIRYKEVRYREVLLYVSVHVCPHYNITAIHISKPLHNFFSKINSKCQGVAKLHPWHLYPQIRHYKINCLILIRTPTKILTTRPIYILQFILLNIMELLP